jgi:hypothetical protein
VWALKPHMMWPSPRQMAIMGSCNFFNFAVLKRIDIQFIVGRRDRRAIHTIFDGICSRTACLRWVVEVGDCHVFSTIK